MGSGRVDALLFSYMGGKEMTGVYIGLGVSALLILIWLIEYILWD